MKEFEALKQEYSLTKTTDERKQKLIYMMQENLRKRIGKDVDSIRCLDNILHRVDSNDVADLYAIDAFLRYQNREREFDNIASIVREKVQKHNQFGPNNPY